MGDDQDRSDELQGRARIEGHVTPEEWDGDEGILGRMMTTKLGTGPSNILLLVGVVVVLVLVGSFVYWLGEDSPGTPDDFRGRVADSGLEVRWSNNGPRGGDGVVQTFCGPVDVTVSELDGVLNVSVPPADFVLLDDAAVAAILSCDG